MKHMLSHHRTRFTAVMMVFVWLLTLGAGFANACLLHQDHAAGGHTRGVVAHDPLATSAGADAHVVPHSVPAQASLHDDDCQLLAADSCRTLCATVQSAVPKQKPLPFADLGAEPVLVTTSGPFRVLSGPVSVSAGAALAPRPEPPVYIRFLRLTL